jgi:hypothetical protein
MSENHWTKKLQEGGENYSMRSFTNCILRHILLCDQAKDNEMSGACIKHEKVRNAYKICVRKREGKNPLGKPRRRWKDNIRIDLRKIWWVVADRIHLALDMDQWQ